MDAFEAIEPAAQGDRVFAARRWLEALRLVTIPAGTFQMGSPETDSNHSEDEGPQRQVTLDRPFQMGATQATQGAWEALMGTNPSRFQGDPTLPVEQVSWNDICGPNGFLKRPNAFGLHDLHGNVGEWCEDTLHDTYKNAPKDGSAWIKDSDPKRRVLRGGNWGEYAKYARSACRDRGIVTRRDGYVGFRVVCALVVSR
jgi:formylglycine-generating enzyme required for sulfatase activity